MNDLRTHLALTLVALSLSTVSGFGCSDIVYENGIKTCGKNGLCPVSFECKANKCWKLGTFVDGGVSAKDSSVGGDAPTDRLTSDVAFDVAQDVAVAVDGSPAETSDATDTSQPDADEVVIPKVTVTIQRNGNGTITGNDVTCTAASCEVSVDVGSNLVLTATPGADSDLKQWSGCTSSTGANCSLVAISTSTQVTATFALKGANLIVLKDGNGTGSVTATWPGGGSLNCGTTCSATIPSNTVVTLNASPSMGSTATWGTASCTGSAPCMLILGTTATTIKATFSLMKVGLTVAASGPGTVTSASVGINCGSACSATVDYGTSVQLTATPSASGVFSAWSAGCTTMSGNLCTVSLMNTANITATFKSVNGVVCTGATGCSSGLCVEGVCCDKACNTGCSSCRAASTGVAEGTCAFVTAGVAHATDCTSTASSTCNTDGTCDGKGACRKWPAGTSCGAATCSADNLSAVPAKTCNGSGTCGGAGGNSCAPYTCNPAAAACFVSCGTCVGATYCSVGVCVAKKNPGVLCSQDGECSSGSCGQQCCNPGVACFCPQPNLKNLIKNPGFATDLSSWSLVDFQGGNPATSISRDTIDSSDDASGNLPCPFSGSVHLKNTSAAIRQCVTLDPAKTYNVGNRARGTGNGYVTCDFESFGAQGCGSFPTLAYSTSWLNVSWSIDLGHSIVSSAQISGKSSARVTCYMLANASGDPPGQEGWVDNVYISENPAEF